MPQHYDMIIGLSQTKEYWKRNLSCKQAGLLVEENAYLHN